MKNLAWVLGACLILSQPTYALLPPLYQTANEIKSILESKELGQKLASGGPILNIQKNDKGYMLITNRQYLQVDIIYKHSHKIGPAEFDLYFHDAHSLD